MSTKISEELLEKTHQFPTKYMLKIVGPADEAFVESVVSAAKAHVKNPDFVDHTVRHSGSGKHASVTLEVKVATAREVVLLYEALEKVPRMVMML